MFGATCEQIRAHLQGLGIEARPLWKPLHLQPVFRGCRVRCGHVAETLFDDGLCLPSGSNLSRSEQQRVIDAISELSASGHGGAMEAIAS